MNTLSYKQRVWNKECDLIYDQCYEEYMESVDDSHYPEGQEYAHEAVSEWQYENPISSFNVKDYE